MLGKAAAIFSIKNTWAAIGSLAASIFMPISDIIIFVGMVIFIDTFLGVWASVKKGGWKVFSSKRGSQGMLQKMIIYPMVLFFASGIEHLFQVPFIVKITAFGIMFWEGKSIHENARKILGVSITKFAVAYLKEGKSGVLDLIEKEGDKDA